MQRRKFLSSVVVAGAASIAGCGGSPSPDLSEPTVDTPDSIAYGSDFSLTVTLENAGGAEGKFRATLKSQDDNLAFSKDINVSVPGGETEEITTEPITPPAAGEYTFVLTGEGAVTTSEDGETSEPESGSLLAETTVTVTTQSVTPGTGVKLNENLLLNVKGVETAKSVFTGDDSENPSNVFEAPTGKVFAIYDVNIENVGSSQATWGPAHISVPEGDLYGENTPQLPGAGEVLNTQRSLNAADSVSGYVFAQLPVDAAASGTPLTAQVTDTGAEPEFQWEFNSDGDAAFPEFELVDLSAPEQAQSGQPYEISLTIANTGAGDGTVKAILQYEGGTFNPGWHHLNTATPGPIIEEEIAAGEEVTVTVTNTTSANGEYNYRVVPFEENWTTSF